MLELYAAFKKSGQSLWVYKKNKLQFASESTSLKPLLSLLSAKKFPTQVTVFDKVIGLAAAKLIFLLKPVAVYAPLGTYRAERFFRKKQIPAFFEKRVSRILEIDGKTECHHEKLSKDLSPKQLLKKLTNPHFKAA